MDLTTECSVTTGTISMCNQYPQHQRPTTQAPAVRAAAIQVAVLAPLHRQPQLPPQGSMTCVTEPANATHAMVQE